jgi:hypothetical protein
VNSVYTLGVTDLVHSLFSVNRLIAFSDCGSTLKVSHGAVIAVTAHDLQAKLMVK